MSVSGDDSRTGRSPGEAWRTLARANEQQFGAGDILLLEGGESFEGPLVFGAEDGGTAENPAGIGTFGLEENGRATIAAGLGRGIAIENASGLYVRDLRVVGDGAKINGGSGILLLSTTGEGAGDILIDNVEVSGFGKHGISVGARNTETGYRNVRITNCTTHDNRLTGIFTWGPWGPKIYAHRDIYIGRTIAYKMAGGSGLTLSSVDGGIIERSIAHNNGEDHSGGAGIWAWDSNNILFQFNESYENKTTGVDGDGFDFDGGVTNSTMQYNYSHDNDAAGFLLAQYRHAPQAMDNIIIRFNISENDCRKKSYGAIHVWNGDARDRIGNIQIYNNTVFLTPRLEKFRADAAGVRPLGFRPYPDVPSAIAIITPVASASVFNNLFMTSEGKRLITVSSGQGKLRFQNNAYWSDDQSCNIDWMNMIYDTLPDWLAAAEDQERNGSEIAAIFADPLLAGPGTGGTLGNPDQLGHLNGYRLMKNSPLAGRGIDLTSTPGVGPDTRGFFGTPISEALPPAIGACLAEN